MQMDKRIENYLVRPVLAGLILVLVFFGVNFILGILSIAPFVIVSYETVPTVVGAVVFLWIDGLVIYLLVHEKVWESLLGGIKW